MGALGSDSYSFVSIAAELSLSSAFYLLLVTKPSPCNNFANVIAYSVMKLLPISCLFTSNLTIWGFSHAFLLFGLLLNEVVLLVWTICNQSRLRSVHIRSIYSSSLLTLRFIGELLVISVVLDIAVVSLFINCKCEPQNAEFLGDTLQRLSL